MNHFNAIVSFVTAILFLFLAGKIVAAIIHGAIP